MTELFKANKWETNRLEVDRNGVIEMNGKMWMALAESSKKNIKQIHTHTSRVESKKENKMGPERGKNIQCDQCTKKFNNKVALATHRWSAHKANTPIRQLVMKGENGEEFKCFICRKTYKNMLSAKNHVTKVCSKFMTEEIKQTWVNRFKFHQAFNRDPD